MLDELKNENNIAFTENGAATCASTLSDCLDLFAVIGALRNERDERINDLFLRAFTEDKLLALKMLFFARDVRGGLGERRVFRTILHMLANSYPEAVRKNLALVSEYGRFDDLMCLLNTPCEDDAVALIRTQLSADIAALKSGDAVSLLGKWLPSVNASNEDTVRSAKRLAALLGMDERTYRKTLTGLRAAIRILENNLRIRDYSFDYEKQPSKALIKYRKAFMRNDKTRYGEFLTRVREGEARMNTATLTPCDIIMPCLNGKPLSEEERLAVDTAWNALEDFTDGENAIVVVDGSGSMYWGCNPLPAAVAQSLAIYYAERNTGAFGGHFITFSRNPKLVEIKGNGIYEKVRYCETFNEVANTDISKVFNLLLKTAVKNKLPQSELPSALYIISDMEFDYCADNASLTNFENAKNKFAEHGYKLPKVVFWQVNSRNRQQPVTKNEQGVLLVSGTSARIFPMLRSGTLNPYAFMFETLNSERYAAVTV